MIHNVTFFVGNECIDATELAFTTFQLETKLSQLENPVCELHKYFFDRPLNYQCSLDKGFEHAHQQASI